MAFQEAPPASPARMDGMDGTAPAACRPISLAGDGRLGAGALCPAMPSAPDPMPFDPAAHGWAPLPVGGFPTHVGPLWHRPAASLPAGASFPTAASLSAPASPPGPDPSPGAPPRFAMLADARHLNIHGIVHGGMVMTFADTGLGITVWHAMGRRPCVTVQFGCQFLDAVHAGDFVELDAEILRRSSTVVFMRGTLRVGARATGAVEGVWKMIRPR